MSEHTAGPWQVEQTKTSIVIGTEYVGDLVAVVGWNVDHEVELANANLIAAAPIGYELAEAVLAWAREPRNHGGNPYLMEHVKLAETFMAQARGQEVNAS